MDGPVKPALGRYCGDVYVDSTRGATVKKVLAGSSGDAGADRREEEEDRFVYALGGFQERLRRGMELGMAEAG